MRSRYGKESDMKRWLLPFFALLLVASLTAAPLAPERSEAVAQAWLQACNAEFQIQSIRTLDRSGQHLATVYTLSPAGYVVVCTDDELPPVVAYSFTSTFSAGDGDLLAELLTEDLSRRLLYMAPATRESNHELWLDPAPRRDPFQQWPPEGSTFTGGWIKTQWTQTEPNNDFCPIDPITLVRSYAGCPAVAMAQIVNYLQTLNGTVFSDADDYHHSYANRNFWIDDDHIPRGFPSWSELNGYLDTLTQHYKYSQEITNQDAAALIWACGVAAEQVYSSEGSGTYSVAQAVDAYQRFGFENFELLTATDADLFDRMAQNMMTAQPVHLAMVTPDWDSGHNVAVDGYNTDGFFHLNFGWGGSYSGWYLLPDQFPYNMNVIEGAIVDIQPREYLFSTPDTLFFLTQESVYQPQILELINISDAPLSIEAINAFPQYLGDAVLSLGTEGWVFPVTIPSGQSLILALQWLLPVELPRELIEGRIEVIHAYGVHSVPMEIDSSLFSSDAEDEIQPPGKISIWPNPFRTELCVKSQVDRELEITVYNLRGQRVACLQGQKSVVWDARDESGKTVGNGIYLFRIRQDGAESWRRAVKLR